VLTIVVFSLSYSSSPPLCHCSVNTTEVYVITENLSVSAVCYKLQSNYSTRSVQLARLPLNATVK
jgi:hypothetical protein